MHTSSGKIKIWILLIILGNFAPQAEAAFTPDIAARASLAGAQQMLVSPPIPNLESTKTSFSPQIGYMTANIDGNEFQTIQGITSTSLTYKGDISGVSGLIGWNSQSTESWGWFAIFGGDYLTGQIDVNMGSTSYGSIKDIKTQAFSLTAGPSYRFIGVAQSPLSAGVFFGPTAIKVNSTFTVSTNNLAYTLDDLVYGAYGGVQLKVRLGGLVINPYALMMQELSPACKKMSISDPNQSFTDMCSTDKTSSNLVEMKSSFSGFGLILGWKALRLNVYSKAVQDSTLGDIKITNYSLSYSFTD